MTAKNESIFYAGLQTFLVCMFILWTLPASAFGATDVTGLIDTPQTWTLPNSPYHVTGNITIGNGGDLIIQPGVAVKFAAGTSMTVSNGGRLTAIAPLDSAAIYFTSYRDDSVETGGDTHGTNPAAGDWWGLVFNNNGDIKLENVEIRYAGSGGSAIHRSGSGPFNMNNSLVRDSEQHGLEIVSYSGAAAVNGCTFTSNNVGANIADSPSATLSIINSNFLSNVTNLYILQSSPTVRGNTISNAIDNGIVIDAGTGLIGTAAPDIINNDITNNSVGIYCINSADPLIGGSASTGNNIFGNTSYGVQNSSPLVTVNAAYNWWGDASGPYHETTNPSGTGDPVSDFVNFASYQVDIVPRQQTLTVARIGAGGGTVTSGAGGINCGIDCTESFDTGTTVALFPTSDPGSVFTGWSGDCSGIGRALVLMDAAKSCTATFEIDTDADGVADIFDSAPQDNTICRDVDNDTCDDCSSGHDDPANDGLDTDHDGICDAGDFIFANSPPLPPEVATVEVGAGNVTLSLKPFVDPEGDNHVETVWWLRRTDQPFVYIQETTGPGVLTTFIDFLDAGLEYGWKAGFMDNGSNALSWSDEHTFVVGDSVNYAVPPLPPGVDVADFNLVSITQWPGDSSAPSVFGIDYDTNYYRIGTYDPVRSEYKEFGPDLFIRPGTAYWVLARDGLDIAVDGVPVALGVDVDVRLAYNATSDDGWNLVAPPNAADYLWEELEVVVYNTAGDLEFGPQPISLLAEDNPYLDRRFWEWDAGRYVAHHPDDALPYLLQRNEGGWVRARRDRVYLRFPAASQVTGLFRSGILIAALMDRGSRWLNLNEAIASGNDSPPLPMGALGIVPAATTGDAGGGGCFIETAWDTSSVAVKPKSLTVLLFFTGIVIVVWHVLKRNRLVSHKK